MPAQTLDNVVIGSGFAGAVVACRLVQAGREVTLLERGKRYEPQDFPLYPPAEIRRGHSSEPSSYRPAADFSRLLWNTRRGLWDLRDLEELAVLQAAGYGGGSLIYANVHLRPPDEVFDHYWPEGYDAGSLGEYFDLAAEMMDVQVMDEGRAPKKGLELRNAFAELARGDRRFTPVTLPLALRLDGTPGSSRGPCDFAANCMFGCAQGAKNSLDANYLAAIADSPLATIRTLTEVERITRVRGGQARYRLSVRDHLVAEDIELDARNVFLCAGAINTTELLMRYRYAVDAEGQDGGGWPSTQERQALANVGRRLFVNNDGIAAVFGTRATQDVDVGPVISCGGTFRTPESAADPVAAHLVRLLLRAGGKGVAGPVPGEKLVVPRAPPGPGERPDKDGSSDVLRVISIEDSIWPLADHDGASGDDLHLVLASPERPVTDMEALLKRLSANPEIALTTGRIATVRYDTPGPVTQSTPAGTVPDGAPVYSVVIELDRVPPGNLPEFVLLSGQGSDGAPVSQTFRLLDLRVDPAGVASGGRKHAGLIATIELQPVAGDTVRGLTGGASLYGVGVGSAPLRVVASARASSRRGILSVIRTDGTAFGMGERVELESGGERHEVWVSTPPICLGEAAGGGKRWTLEISPAPAGRDWRVVSPGKVAATAYRPPQTWLMVQDGGVPQAIAPLLGAFRSPLLLGRNRHRHPDPDAAGGPGERARRFEELKSEDYLVPPFADLVALLADLPGGGQGQGSGRLVSDGLPYAQVRESDWSVLPNRLRDNLLAERAVLTDRVSRTLAPLLEGFLERTAKRLEDKLDIETLLSKAGGPAWLTRVGAGGVVHTDLVMALVQLLVQLGWNNQANLVTELGNYALERILPQRGEDIGRRVNALAAWALDYRVPSRHDTLLLIMGRDSHPMGLRTEVGPGTDDFFNGLRAVAVDRIVNRDADDRRRVLRGVNAASRWQGELRSDPLATLFDVSLTVHPQGGCAMGGDPRHAVTDPAGQVHGHPGLYVMDAAAFPVSVGVNPSATILAVAEKKIRELLRDDPPAAVLAGVPQARRRSSPGHDPLNAHGDVPAPPADPQENRLPEEIGLRFREVLFGYFTLSARAQAGAPAPPPGHAGMFDRAEHLGIGERSRLTLDIRVDVPCLERFIRAQERHAITYAGLSGCVAIDSPHVNGGHELRLDIDPARSSVRYDLRGGTSHGTTRSGATLEYCIDAREEEGGRQLEFGGLKNIDNREGDDLWSDITSLQFEMSIDGKRFAGTLRQSIAEFFSKTNPSIEVTGSGDPVVESWAIARYTAFFVQTLATHYSPVSLRRLRRMLGLHDGPRRGQG